MLGFLKGRRGRHEDERSRDARPSTTGDAGGTNTLPLIGEDGAIQRMPDASLPKGAPAPGDTAGIAVDAVEAALGAAPGDLTLAERIATRYRVEHRELRTRFLADPQALVDAVSHRWGLYALYRQVFEEAGVPFPYHAADFSANTLTLADDLTLTCLTLPAPEAPLLCRRIYLVCDPRWRTPGYYTIERGAQGGYLCFWDGENHVNAAPLDTPEPVDATLLALEAVAVGKVHLSRFAR